ncbi:Clp protease ClpB [Mariniradius sediminis]|uniref:Clp protease ClpB n=1 Tax=Mariniradius sediminis TaxID=2909237 RepID=A0ABS9BX21_9BACT|nr:Clp protease ClpB [Mariniradius sediminis]MCF1751992.1 Clp protease ClpB [Mariniradius sediminis]
MRIILLVCLAFLLVSESFAQEKLKKLVEERESLHQAWKVSESKKTGIFGNRTKKDMVETHGWMERIIDKDNLIMEELKLLRDIEKTEITYEKNDYKFISQKQEREIATLKKVLAEKDLEMQEKQKSTRTYEWTTLIFFVSTLLLGFAYSRKRRS